VASESARGVKRRIKERASGRASSFVRMIHRQVAKNAKFLKKKMNRGWTRMNADERHFPTTKRIKRGAKRERICGWF
jgi:hypothetical protein